VCAFQDTELNWISIDQVRPAFALLRFVTVAAGGTRVISIWLHHLLELPYVFRG
jgi:hypothetical protein